jgi:hypothetical protein
MYIKFWDEMRDDGEKTENSKSGPRLGIELWLK